MRPIPPPLQRWGDNDTLFGRPFGISKYGSGGTYTNLKDKATTQAFYVVGGSSSAAGARWAPVTACLYSSTPRQSAMPRSFVMANSSRTSVGLNTRHAYTLLRRSWRAARATTSRRGCWGTGRGVPCCCPR